MTEIGTGDLGSHKLDNHYTEYKAIRVELERLGLKSVWWREMDYD